MAVYIGDIAEPVPCISQMGISKEVDKIFSENTKIHGVVVVNEEVPISLITRTNFYQKMGTLYGYNLYMGRSIELIANHEPLIVDYFQSITEVSRLAMERKEEDRYDYVIVTKEDKYIGIVSIQRLLMTLVEVQTEFASLLNPLTRLPGNHIIDDKLKEIINQKNFSILYFDLDHFKAYNDTYGFKKGDELLQATADLLKRTFEKSGVFLGHIGGDDFIGVLNHYDVLSICEPIMEDFDRSIVRFYHSTHLSQDFVITENRQGVKEKIALVSLSIAAVTNECQPFQTVEELVEYAAIVKKRCKKIKGSCCLINNEDQGDHDHGDGSSGLVYPGILV
ncbi:GGDEF domain-containing protein [Bacillus sp. EB106-08-02-XG196]|uniref:GGDEF domain-containing protein n=1 Tax=Bacillus sp. EB106-08-02-XG196 TaxID=2737049 RepID=UPI0015C4205E|nr:GGDEF domain-containing protein [Bacillus sp. EB106-08-02-XG196]NWQ41804.1 GGDEF domain-containing protein [Bacillus sp. EB106-08-02-XG196]